ncbi:MAG: DUF1501 domain-containing protein [Planctomycetaceae bacterium]|jgi:uncharacterized protein (DUF1501 family)|nr:DUF1501 domain-containing protein [Planctomycetaceae bacterium]
MKRCTDHPMSRRNVLSVGALAGLGLTFTDFLRIKSAQADQKDYVSKEGPAKSVIFIFLPGGMAHQESFDPKPYAPLEYRGPLGSIATSIPGVRFGELMPQTAQIADRLCICPSMTHGEAAHERGTHNMYTGYRPSPALQYPSMGSVVSHEFGPRHDLPPYVMIPSLPNVYAGTGYLSSSYAGFSLGADPAGDGFKVRDLELPGGVDEQRFGRRRNMLEAVNQYFTSKEQADSLNAVDTFYQRAYSILSSEKARLAFDIDKEDPALRDRYGRNTAGARLLLARRLVESGVRFVSLTYGGWDHHDNIEGNMRGQMPPLDQGFATLIRDLEERGLLDSTLVCMCTEFGRTPKINQTGGRDHWPKVFTTVMAGGGLKKGIVYGSSNSTASEPEDNPLTVEDWATTVYDRLGIVADKELMAPGNRPIEICDGGKVIKEMIV